MHERGTSQALRQLAAEIFQAGVTAADPRRAVLEALEIAPDGRPVIAGERVVPAATLRIVSFGKAAVTMAAAVSERLVATAFSGPGIVVVNPENEQPLDRFRVFTSSHPIPDSAGVEAAAAVVRYIGGSGAQDALLVLISGGGSALLPSPPAGITLHDKAETTRLLLEAGAPIQELNAVRKHLSALKGGGMARLAQPARVESLILSDVIGDDLSSIASGPTAPDPTTFNDVAATLSRYGLTDQVPPAVRERVASGVRGEIADTPGPGDPVFGRVRNRLVGSNRQSLAAVRDRARDLGFEPRVLSDELVGEARDAAAFFRRRMADLGAGDRPLALLAGGETTVTVRGSGKGGRNQEMALAFALLCASDPPVGNWVFLSGGTDGRDGPTDAAGGLVDSDTVARLRTSELDAESLLANNDSYRALAAAGDLLVTGSTGTNVADLQILLVNPAVPGSG